MEGVGSKTLLECRSTGSYALSTLASSCGLEAGDDAKLPDWSIRPTLYHFYRFRRRGDPEAGTVPKELTLPTFLCDSPSRSKLTSLIL